MGFHGSSAGKESTCNAGDPSLISGLERFPGERIGYPLQYSCLENPQGQRRLAKCSPWGRKGVEHNLATKQRYVQSHVLDM